MGLTATILFTSFALFLLLSVPIGISIGLSTLVTIALIDILPVSFLAKEFVTSVDSFPLMAVPFFILAGEIMGKGGISHRLVNVATSIVGNKTGGLAIAGIITSLFFAAISGSGPATVAAVGGMMIPAMVDHGYDKRFATAVIASAGALGVIIPPSIPMVIYGVIGSASIGDLFISGVIPGVLVAFGLMVWSYIYAKKMGYTGTDEKMSIKKIGESLYDAKWALLIPIIILGGIYGGIFTPTEAAVVAVVYSFMAGIFLYREIKLQDLPRLFADGALTTATILIIVGAATAFGRLLTIEEIPTQVADIMLSITDERIILVFLIITLLLIVGCFMDTLAAIIILTPILLPIAINLNFDPIHFGIIMVTSLAIGFITPPLGVNLFVSSGISGLSISVLSRAIVPFFIAMVITLLIITFIPQLSLILIN